MKTHSFQPSDQHWILPLAKPNGFAIAVTLSLMFVLTVVAVGLLTLSGIFLRSSSRTQAMAVASALMIRCYWKLARAPASPPPLILLCTPPAARG